MKPINGLMLAMTTLTMLSCSRLSPSGDNDGALYKSDAFAVYPDSVVQGDYVAKALSPLEITTNYRSQSAAATSSLARFRFSLNSRDNEMAAGRSHAAFIRPGADADTVYTFGTIGPQEPTDSDVPADTLPKNTRWTVALDMRPILRSFDRRGYYVAAEGDTIYADDFKGVWIAGSVDPLTWDFENLYGKNDRKLRDRGDSIYEVTLTLNPPAVLRPDPVGWKTDSVNPNFPTFSSDQMLVDALYNMSVDELASNLRKDGAYRAGKEWDGVWTRDVSYSIYLSLAYLDPEGSMNSLRAKVKNGRIVQDTGTGGAWPVSSDRVVWAVAAWEIYKVTGDHSWLKEAFEIIDATLKDDMAVVYDPTYCLMHGEQSYLDWREQTYPRWMQPADIYGSMCLGTNVVFAHTFELMARMASELNIPAIEYRKTATRLRESINDNLWLPNLGYYSEYLYGTPYPINSMATDNLGQSLGILFDITTPEMASSIISRTPVGIYGTTSVFPQIADIKPYHNDAVWPFVQAFWNLAAAKTGNVEAVKAGLAAIYRAAALFATNKELFVASTGDYRGTAVNSDAQLWSAAGHLAMTFRLIAGITFESDRMEFHPFIPQAYSGTKHIKGFRYRDAVLDINISGNGNRIASVSIDGKNSKPFIPATLTGQHTVDIIMANNSFPEAKINITEPTFMPSTPVVKWGKDGHTARIENFDPANSYLVMLNGEQKNDLEEADYTLYNATEFTTVNFTPVFDNRVEGFSMRPHFFIPRGSMTLIQAEDVAEGGTKLIKDEEKAAKVVELTTRRNTHIEMQFDAKDDGVYFVDVRYANGSGPINTDNKCAIRTLSVNGRRIGAIVMPQRGIGEWLSTGFSNMLRIEMHSGLNTLSIDYITPTNVNMNGDVNTALIDYIRIIKK